MNQYKYIIESIDGRIGRLSLNRPELHNAFNIEMIRELIASISYLNKQENIVLIYIAAKGPDFSSGADLNWMKANEKQSSEQHYSESKELASLFNTIYNSAKITLAAVQGNVIGGANGIIAAVDISVSAKSACFSFPEVRLGLVPATIAPYILLKTGQGIALEWMLTGRKIDAEEAYRRGLTNHLADDADLDTKCFEIIKMILRNGPEAMYGIKQFLKNSLHIKHPDELVDTTAGLIAKYRNSKEGLEGISAFLENRQPGWTNE